MVPTLKQIAAAALTLFGSAALSDPRATVAGRLSGIEFELDPGSATYSLRFQPFGWTLTGHSVGAIRSVARGHGQDPIGQFKSLSFRWWGAMKATVQVYDDRPVVLFRLKYLAQQVGNGAVFPEFDSVQSGLRTFSYRDQTFAPPTFGPSQTCSPCLYFAPSGHSFVVSPASNFMLASMVADGSKWLGCGLNREVSRVPAGFEQTALIAFGDGIGRCWDNWGLAMRALHHRPVPSSQRGPVLRDFGYWTDNGADYYYNYEPEKGYAGTLLALRDRYRDEGIPLGYLQLDSWWYDKSIDDPTGKSGPATKNPKLPAGLWNRYGGLMQYRADRDLFPEGLAAFQQKLGLPLAVHNRWMDRKSPYHGRFQISGVATTDRRWWDEVAAYLSSGGVTCYEQDWLDRIYQNSPEMGSKPGVGDAFTDGMAGACRSRGLDMQYCMSSPRFILQGLKYPNLTTIRTSGDRFEPGKWADFLFVSQLAQEVGIWPWCDVFKSGETGNMIVSVLSAGPVGTGDRIGAEDKENILKAARPDGVLVKPDRSLLPCDQAYLDPDAPLLASTYTGSEAFRTSYLFGFPRTSSRNLRFRARDAVSATARRYLYDFDADSGRFVDADEEVSESIGPLGYVYLMAAPVSRSGLVLLGDLDKFVPAGRQRLSEIVEIPRGIRCKVQFASGEGVVRLTGVSPIRPRAVSPDGQVELLGYDAPTGRFRIEVKPREGRSEATVSLLAIIEK